MRIIHVITRLIVGGAQENTVLSCEGLHARGHEVYLLAGPTTGPEGSLVERARAGGYVYEEIPSLVRQISPNRDFWAMYALRKRYDALKPDVVHTHSSKAGILGRIPAHQLRVPAIVHTIHGMSFNRTQPWWMRHMFKSFEQHCAKRCHAIVTVAHAMTEQALAAGVGRPDQYRTIRSGMVIDDFDPAKFDRAAVRGEWGVSENEVVVGTVARLFANKGYEQLIEIMSRAVSRQPNLRFVWIGDGSHRAQYEATLKQRGLRDRVTLTGLIPPADMPRVLSGIDILAHTSQWEGLPRACVQALLMEKPVVSFDIDGAPEVVTPGVTGELAPLGDIVAFADAIVSLAEDGSRRADYGRRGRGLCAARFDHRLMVERLEALYEELLEPRGA